MRGTVLLRRICALFLSLAIGFPPPAFALRSVGLEENNVLRGQLEQALTGGLEESGGEYGFRAGAKMWWWGAGPWKRVVISRFGRETWADLRKPAFRLLTRMKQGDTELDALRDVSRILADAGTVLSPGQSAALIDLANNRLLHQDISPGFLLLKFVPVVTEIAHRTPEADRPAACQQMVQAMERFVNHWDLSQPEQKERIGNLLRYGHRIFFSARSQENSSAVFGRDGFSR